MEIKGWDEWAEAHLGNNVKREVAVGLDERSGWRQHLVLGRRYWLRCDEAGLLGVGKLGLDRFWRYGSMDTVELPFKIRLRDPEAVSIPLEASNTLEFAVEE